MLSQAFAIAIVTLAVLGPGLFLWRYARNRGGLAKKLAGLVLAAAILLVCWLVFFSSPDSTHQERISQFIGAWGILFMTVGFVVIGVEIRKMLKAPKRGDSGD